MRRHLWFLTSACITQYGKYFNLQRWVLPVPKWQKNDRPVGNVSSPLTIERFTMEAGRLNTKIGKPNDWLLPFSIWVQYIISQLIWLGSSRRLQNCTTDTEMNVLGSLIRPVDSVRDLGVLFDSGLTLFNHVNEVAALCYFHIRQLCILRRTLTDEVAHSLVRALIHNRIHYCNGILPSSPKYLTDKLLWPNTAQGCNHQSTCMP